MTMNSFDVHHINLNGARETTPWHHQFLPDREVVLSYNFNYG